MTFTCVSVTSGKASIGSPLNAAMPAPMKSTNPSTTKSGWRRANETMRLIIPRLGRGALPVRRGVDLLQEEAAVDDDLVAVLQPARDGHLPAALGSRLDFPARVAPGAFLHEHEVPVADQEHRLGRHREAFERRRLELGRDEHFALEAPVRV